MAQNRPPDTFDAPPHTIIDARGLSCPLPVLRLRKRLKDVPVGGIAELQVTDRAALKDVPNFCRTQGHALLGVVSQDGIHTFRVRRGI